MMGTNSNSNLQKQMSCNECNNVLTVKDSIKAWLIDKYVFFCSNDCIAKNTKVEFLDCKICNRSVKLKLKIKGCINKTTVKERIDLDKIDWTSINVFSNKEREQRKKRN